MTRKCRRWIFQITLKPVTYDTKYNSNDEDWSQVKGSLDWENVFKASRLMFYLIWKQNRSVTAKQLAKFRGSVLLHKYITNWPTHLSCFCGASTCLLLKQAQSNHTILLCFPHMQSAALRGSFYSRNWFRYCVITPQSQSFILLQPRVNAF